MLVSESGERWPDAEDKLSVPLKRLILSRDISAAILAETSPTCGVQTVCDGHFHGQLTQTGTGYHHLALPEHSLLLSREINGMLAGTAAA